MSCKMQIIQLKSLLPFDSRRRRHGRIGFLLLLRRWLVHLLHAPCRSTYLCSPAAFCISLLSWHGTARAASRRKTRNSGEEALSARAGAFCRRPPIGHLNSPRGVIWRGGGSYEAGSCGWTAAGAEDEGVELADDDDGERGVRGLQCSAAGLLRPYSWEAQQQGKTAGSSRAERRRGPMRRLQRREAPPKSGTRAAAAAPAAEDPPLPGLRHVGTASGPHTWTPSDGLGDASGPGDVSTKTGTLGPSDQARQARTADPTDDTRPGEPSCGGVGAYLQPSSCMQALPRAHPLFLRKSSGIAERKASPAMGISASNPCTQKTTNQGENQLVKYASSTVQGCCQIMEDALAAELDIDVLKATSFFGVFDGHGGADVARYCAKRFHTMLLEDEHFQNSLPNAIRSVCSRIDDDLKRSNEWRESVNPRDNGNWFQCLPTGICANLWCSTEETPYVGPLYEGSTACVVIIRGNQITVGNVGDSCCVLSLNGQAFDLSRVHRPSDRGERARIQAAGGRVYVYQTYQLRFGEGRVMKHVHRIQGRLAVSRAIGDFGFKQNERMRPPQQMVTCVPDINDRAIPDGAEFLVIATGGVWNCMSSQNVVNFVHARLNSGEENLGNICEELLETCCLFSMENATIILVQFKRGAIDVAPPVLSCSIEEEAETALLDPGNGAGQGTS
ncbi:hypothetical protein ABZP36_023294 [Zizania latifolia]